MKIILLLLLPFIIFNVRLSNYSINDFLTYLERTGYYKVFLAIKIEFGSDYAIEACNEFIHSPDCDIAVNVYMRKEMRARCRSDDISKKNSNLKSLIELFHKDEILKVLTQFYTIKEIDKKIVAILKQRLIFPDNINNIEIKDE